MAVSPDLAPLTAAFKAIYSRAAVDSLIVDMGSPPPPMSWRRRFKMRLRRKWFDLRVWIAERVLRVSVE